MTKYLLGLDIGSSSVKACLVDVGTGKTVSSAQSPKEEMGMVAAQPGWAEQNPDMWWAHVVNSVKECLTVKAVDGTCVEAIGISYQMHGLVAVDKSHKPVRSSIIWCDSRAVEIGDRAFQELTPHYCLKHLLNSPGNFTASKLKWVRDNEPATYERIYKVMLPGDYIALKLTGNIVTTDTGLSEGMFWDYPTGDVSEALLSHYGIDKSLLASRVPVFGDQGRLREDAAKELGLKAGAMIAYRAGDQPNNALSLNVLNPGETAATAGTSGVIYSVTEANAFDPQSRVNAFIHVNNKWNGGARRNGILLCVNGTGILNSWLRRTLQSNDTPYAYPTMNALAAETPIGAGGISMLPFGNGAERILENRSIGASVFGLNFNQHSQAHLFRAAQEGIVFALYYGFEILQSMGVSTTVIRAGHANMFLSPMFREAFVNTINARLELYDTDGAKGAALGAGVGSGLFDSFSEAFKGLQLIAAEDPQAAKRSQYVGAYDRWKNHLHQQLANN